MEKPAINNRIKANRHRGEIAIDIDGSPRILCLTLGALAELEATFKVNNLAELGSYFSIGKFSANDLVYIIGAGLRGGGNLYTDEDVMCMSIEGGSIALAKAAADLLKVTFNCVEDKADQTEAVGSGQNERGLKKK